MTSFLFLSWCPVIMETINFIDSEGECRWQRKEEHDQNIAS